MNTLLKGCVPVKTSGTRWMLGCIHGGRSVPRSENGPETAMDVPVHDVGIAELDEAYGPSGWGRRSTRRGSWQGDTSSTSGVSQLSTIRRS